MHVFCVERLATFSADASAESIGARRGTETHILVTVLQYQRLGPSCGCGRCNSFLIVSEQTLDGTTSVHQLQLPLKPR